MTTCAILLVSIAASGVISIFGLEVIFGLRVNFIGRSFFGLLANFIGRSFFGLLVGPAQSSSSRQNFRLAFLASSSTLMG
jgi:hypothetical protein